MDTLKSILVLYKKELADAIELKFIYQSQVEQQQQLEQQLKEKDEQINKLQQEIPKIVE